MKIILLEDIKKIGKRYEIKDVKPGLARNFLIPQNKALPATDANIARFKKHKELLEEKNKLQKELLEKALNDLKNKEITIKAHSNEEGHLYAQISKEEIKDALYKIANINIKTDNIKLEEPIKQIGKFKIDLVVGDKEGSFILNIEQDNTEKSTKH